MTEMSNERNTDGAISTRNQYCRRAQQPMRQRDPATITCCYHYVLLHTPYAVVSRMYPSTKEKREEGPSLLCLSRQTVTEGGLALVGPAWKRGLLKLRGIDAAFRHAISARSLIGLLHQM